jgi:iron complex transport system substrate-binding protein
VSLNPDVVLIPAWGKDKTMNDVEKLEDAGIPVVFTDFWGSPLDNPSISMKLIGKIFGEEDRADEIAQFFDDKIAGIKETIGKKKAKKPTVYVECAWKSIKEYGNSYGNSAGWGALVNAAGGINIAGDVVNATTGTISPEYLLSKNPDKIVFSGSYWKDAPESLRLGYTADPSRARELLDGLTTRDGWQNLDAVKNKEVYGLFHGMSFHIYNYIGLEALAKWFYPDLFGEFDPEGDFKEFHRKYMPYDLSGTWFTSLRE